MDPHLQADGIFRSIIHSTDPAASIRNMIGNVPESVYLDYKEAGTDESTKENWARALSGFANTAGGVVVWGLKCAAGSLLPTQLALVQKPEQLKARLAQLVPCLTEEPVSNVEIRCFPNTAISEEGFVVCYVPLSPRRPHRVVRGKEFMFRITDNFVPVPVASLRSLFFPQAYSRLEVFYQLRHESSTFGLRLWAQLHNDGPSSAKDLVFSYQAAEAAGTIYPTTHWIQNVSSVTGTYSAYIAPQYSPLHPKQFVTLFTIDLPSRSSWGIANMGRIIRWKIFLSDQQPAQFEIDATGINLELDRNYQARLLPESG